jgi:multidrug efflux pump subunit AcrA (membrane-fusion protein)
MKNVGRQLTISGAVVGVLVIAGIAMARFGGKEEEKKPPASDPNIVNVSPEGKKISDIESALVTKSTIQRKLQTSGQVFFPTDSTVKIAPKLTGRIENVFVHVGDRVTAGQTVATLSSVDAAAAQTTALQAQATAQQAKMDLDRFQRLYDLGTPDVTSAQAALDQAVSGEEAAKNVLTHAEYQAKIGGFTEKPLEDAENALITANSTLSQARSDAALAAKDLSRKRQLVQIGVNPLSDLEASQNTSEKAVANLQASEESVRLAKQAVSREQQAFKSHLYSDQQVQQAASAYRQAVLQKNAAATALRLAKAQVLRDLSTAKTTYRTALYAEQNAQRALEILGRPSANGLLEIKSPISGVVTERDVSSGQVVDQSQMAPWQLMVVSDTDRVWVDADVYENDISQVKIGSTVEIRVDALPDQVFQGSVLKIAPTLDKTSRSVKVRVEIANPGGQLRDGEYAEVTLPLGTNQTGIFIPMSAVDHEGASDFVFLDQGSKYVKKEVHIKAQEGQRCLVVSGLEPGQRIAVRGAIFLGGQITDN